MASPTRATQAVLAEKLSSIVKKLARQQAALDDKRANLLLRRSTLQASSERVEDQRNKTSIAGAVFMSQLRKHYNAIGSNIPKIIQDAYENLDEARNKLGSMETELCRAKAEHAVLEWTFSTHENLLYQYDLQNILNGDGSKNAVDSEEYDMVANLPPPPPPPPPPPLPPHNSSWILPEGSCSNASSGSCDSFDYDEMIRYEKPVQGEDGTMSIRTAGPELNPLSPPCPLLPHPGETESSFLGIIGKYSEEMGRLLQLKFSRQCLLAEHPSDLEIGDNLHVQTGLNTTCTILLDMVFEAEVIKTRLRKLRCAILDYALPADVVLFPYLFPSLLLEQLVGAHVGLIPKRKPQLDGSPPDTITGLPRTARLLEWLFDCSMDNFPDRTYLHYHWGCPSPEGWIAGTEIDCAINRQRCFLLDLFDACQGKATRFPPGSQGPGPEPDILQIPTEKEIPQSLPTSPKPKSQGTHPEVERMLKPAPSKEWFMENLAITVLTPESSHSGYHSEIGGWAPNISNPNSSVR